MRSHISSKSDTYTERVYVDAAGISVKVVVYYLGRSASLATRLRGSGGPGMRLQKSAEGILT
jgi:hypothetical protein